MTDIKRRSFFSLFAAPAIVRVSSLMPLSLLPAAVLAAAVEPPVPIPPMTGLHWQGWENQNGLLVPVWASSPSTAAMYDPRSTAINPDARLREEAARQGWAPEKCFSCGRYHPLNLACKKISDLLPG